jgi:hypothetical protein
MNMRSAHRLAFSLALALAGTTAVSTITTQTWAQARKPVRESLPLEARGHWDAGVALAQRKNWDGARTSFQAAYDMSKNPRVLFNVAVAEKELGRYAAALDTFKKEQEQAKGQLTPDEEKELAAAIAGLEKLVGQLTIEVSEKGEMEVFIDDEKVDASKLPGPYTVKVGERRVRVVKAGFQEGVGTTQVSGGGKGIVQLKLIPLIKTSRVNVNVIGPANAIVKVDGKEVGPSPYAGQVTVQESQHVFSAEAPGYVPATKAEVVKEGETLNITLQLAMEQEKGKLLVFAKPEGATIEIDGKVAGATKWEGPVDARVHQVVVKKQGFYTWSYDVEVPRGGERSVTAALNEDRNTSFVPWLIGTIVIGAAITAGIIFIASGADEEPQRGTLSPFVFGTTSYKPGFSF